MLGSVPLRERRTISHGWIFKRDEMEDDELPDPDLARRSGHQVFTFRILGRKRYRNVKPVFHRDDGPDAR